MKEWQEYVIEAIVICALVLSMAYFIVWLEGKETEPTPIQKKIGALY